MMISYYSYRECVRLGSVINVYVIQHSNLNALHYNGIRLTTVVHYGYYYLRIFQ